MCFCRYLDSITQLPRVIVSVTIGNFSSWRKPPFAQLYAANNKKHNSMLAFILTCRFYWTHLDSIVMAIVWHSRIDVSTTAYTQRQQHSAEIDLMTFSFARHSFPPVRIYNVMRAIFRSMVLLRWPLFFAELAILSAAHGDNSKQLNPHNLRRISWFIASIASWFKSQTISFRGKSIIRPKI